MRQLIEMLRMMRHFDRERMRLRRLRRALVAGAAISGCVPALAAMMPLPRALNVLAIIWAAFLFAFLVVASEELLLALDHRRVRAQLSRGAAPRNRV
jgi:hypothetical protein